MDSDAWNSADTSLLHARGFLLYPLVRWYWGLLERIMEALPRSLPDRLFKLIMVVGFGTGALWWLTRAPVFLWVCCLAWLPLLGPPLFTFMLAPLMLIEWFVWRAYVALRRDEKVTARQVALFSGGFLGYLVLLTIVGLQGCSGGR